MGRPKYLIQLIKYLLREELFEAILPKAKKIEIGRYLYNRQYIFKPRI